jgi:SAM-dependent methyltransferase
MPRRRGHAAARAGLRRDAALEWGSDAHYVDPAYYAATYADRDDDIAYYVELALDRACAGPCRVLEYGCGNGRIALPIAHSGVAVTGVDRSVPMLADFRKRLGRNPEALRRRVEIKRGDMRSLRLKRRFQLVLCTFNTFLHLYTRRDVEQFCARVRDHLVRGGRFVLDVSMPDPSELASDPDKAYRTPRFRHPTRGEVVRYAERFDYDPLTQVLMVDMEFEPKGRPKDRWSMPLAHRQFFPCELEALLHYNGLDVVEQHANFERRPPDRDTTTLIYHCKKRG